MKRLGGGMVFLSRVYPVLVSVLLLVITVLNWHALSLAEMLFVWAAGAFACLVVWLQTDGLADEVLDGGDCLIVRMGTKAARVPIRDIESVNESVFFNYGRVTLRLMRPCVFGYRIVFQPVLDICAVIPFARSRVTDDLMDRVGRAQRAES
jgi:hypothetical protein